jgi:purine-binding chemotaxis protein CheW
MTHSTLQAPVATLPVLIITLRNLNLAIRMEGVKKVIPLPPIFRSSHGFLGVANLESQGVIVIDLYQKIYGTPHPEHQGYLITLQAGGDLLYGIPSLTLPVMARIPTEGLHPLSPDYRDRDALGIASHLISMEHGGEQRTIFLVDMAKIWQESLAEARHLSRV